MQQRGFTLIELIVVIVILGILAVTAAPRFIDLQGDARRSTLQGVRAALQGGAQLVYARAAIGGVQNAATSTVTVNGVNVAVANGYPDADTINDFVTIQAFVDLVDEDWDYDDGNSTAALADNQFGIAPANSTPDYTNGAESCHVVYTNAAANSAPDVTVVATGC